MKKSKKVLILILGILLQISLFAQKKADLKNAQKFFKTGEYYNAIVSYEVYLGIKKPSVAFSPYNQKKKNNKKIDSTVAAETIITSSKLLTNNAAWELGESYRQQYHYLRAEKCYARILQKGDDATHPLARYWYAVCLRSNSKFDEASTQINQFLAQHSSNPEHAALAKKEIATLAYIDASMKSPKAKEHRVNKLSGNIAQTEGAYAPVVFYDTLYFTSARIVDTVNKYSKKNTHVNHLFLNSLSENDAVIGKSTMLRFPSKLSINEGTPAFVPDRSRLFFGRSTTVKGKTSIAIYVSNRINDSVWSEPEKLDSNINKPSFNSMQPSITPDGKYLLFTSNRTGGLGKLDIWAAALSKNGNIGTAFNVSTINTAEDEQAAFYHFPTSSLIFSSTGYPGMGGYDFFAAKGATLKSLQKPVNLGYPINSPKDDIYFYNTTTDDLLKKAYISSDRKSDCCLEIFAVNEVPKPIYKHRIKLDVADCKTNTPLATTTVETTNNNGASKETTSDANGLVTIDKAENIVSLHLSKEGYIAQTQPFAAAKELDADTVYTIHLCLDSVKIKTPERVIDSINASDKLLVIYFDFDKSLIKEEAKPILQDVLAILKKYPSLTVILDINGYTDSKGSVEYNLRLGKQRAEACKAYLVAEGIDATRMQLKSFGKTGFVAPNTTPDKKDNPEGRALNRRVEINIKANKK